MSFGLRNAGQTFQRFIDGVLHGLDICFAYIDDILVFSANNDLRILFQRLSDHGLQVNAFKSCLGKASVTFLGYQVSSEGTRTLPDRITDLQNFPGTNTTFSRHGLRGAQPLTWTSELDADFSKRKEALSEIALLTHPAHKCTFRTFYGYFCSPRWSSNDACRWTLSPFATYRKVFVFLIGTKEVRISVDRIKPAYVLADDPPSCGPSLPTPGSSRPTVTPRSGRRLRFLDFLAPAQQPRSSAPLVRMSLSTSVGLRPCLQHP
ncbi:uncharacterized protein TNCT_64431 [Trichonephila clavata]|uniref:Reverse transcriptase domain-containing protein n=1 Tax=Trichonephila clavata TaxID=2740835 RepID=A0A8X6FY66_TRICU|nr:uncharacterized protein TNCT_64431 [Trichonephila clavata]